MVLVVKDVQVSHCADVLLLLLLSSRQSTWCYPQFTKAFLLMHRDYSVLLLMLWLSFTLLAVIFVVMRNQMTNVLSLSFPQGCALLHFDCNDDDNDDGRHSQGLLMVRLVRMRIWLVFGPTRSERGREIAAAGRFACAQLSCERITLPSPCNWAQVREFV